MLVGITGNIGSGKSSLSKFLRLKGFSVFDADEIGKSALQSEAKEQVIETFGRRVLNKNGLIDTAKLASIVFSDSSALSLLTSILHPYIVERIEKIKADYFERVAFVEAAVIVEYGWQSYFDGLVLVFAHRGQRLLRAARRFGLKEAIRRDSLQLSYGEKLKYADYLICNTKTLLHLKDQTELLIEEIEKC